MDRTERYHHIDRLLRAHRAVSMRQLVQALGASRATINRDIEYLRDRLNAPIVYDRAHGGYRYDEVPGEPPFALPGLWFNADEIHALLTCYRLLADLQPGLLEPHIRPLQERLRKILEKTDPEWEEVTRRVRILPLASRRVPPEHFTVIADTLLARKRLRISHFHREHNTHTERNISPQRLVHYRDNWYLDAWCHLREDLRTFSLDSIQHAQHIDAPARDIPDTDLDARFASAYGIFAGPAAHTAVLRFTPERARWIAQEQWHPDQQGAWLADGQYELRIPYSDSRELVMDILKYGPDVEVAGPESLRVEVKARLARAVGVYADEKNPQC